MKAQMEKPFEYLRRKENNANYEKDIVDNWYKARAFVLEKLKDVAFKPTDNNHLHVVVDVDRDKTHFSPLMLAVVRQIALSAHYMNFFEGNEQEPPRNRTVITIVSRNPHVKEELEKEEYLCNLLQYCFYKEGDSIPENPNSYVDLEFHVVPEWTNEEKFRFSEKDVEDFCETKYNQGEDIFSIDTRMADYASRMYGLGAAFDNLPAEDIHCTKRYSSAINIFQYKKLSNAPQLIVNGKKQSWKDLSLCKIKEEISNIMCADCFTIRERSIEICRESKSQSLQELWATYNEPLSRSEHARWVAEKLILGYRPLNAKERYYDEMLQMQGANRQARASFRNMLKRNDCDPAHIDLCSYRDLRRINPSDLKYDSFLMLAIPIILRKI